MNFTIYAWRILTDYWVIPKWYGEFWTDSYFTVCKINTKINSKVMQILKENCISQEENILVSETV